MTRYSPKTRVKALLSTAALAMVMFPTAASAQLVTAGDLVGSFTATGTPGAITITNPTTTSAVIDVTAPTVIAEWTQFNVPTGTVLDITNGSFASRATLLNRVIGGTESDIGGTINASDVNLWLINQNGIIFGNGASVNASSFVASTLDVADQDFFDFGNGTNIFNNGSSTVNFSGASVDGITAAGATITTDGSLVFASQALNLNGTFDAGTGRAAFVAASDLDVTFNAGSPLGYTLRGGTTIANQSLSGSVTGAGVEFHMLSAAGVVGALLQIDASLTATTATASEAGIVLSADGLGSSTTALNTTAIINSTGAVDIDTRGNYTATAAVTGSAVDINTELSLSLADVTATSGAMALFGGVSVDAGALNAAGDMTIDAFSNGTSSVNLASATAGGALVIGGLSRPDNVTITGTAQGGSVDIRATQDVDLQDVTATAGDLILSSRFGNLSVGNVTANAGNVDLFSYSDFDAGDVTASGNIDLEQGESGNGDMDLGTLIAGGHINLDVIGDLNAGAVTAGGLFSVGSTNGGRSRSATFTGDISATSVDIKLFTALIAEDIEATTGTIDIDGGSVDAGALTAGDNLFIDTFGNVALTSASAENQLAMNVSTITITGATTGGSVSLGANSDITLGTVSATDGAVYMTSTTGNINSGAVSAVGGDITLNLAGDATLASATASDGMISIFGSNLTTGSMSAQRILAQAQNTITLNAGAVLSATGSGDAIVLSSSIFTNNSNAGALQTGANGRFLVYTNDWDNNQLNGLAGGNLYNRAYSSGGIALSGDRFVYTRQPTLTLSVADARREYGLANPLFAILASGLVNGDTLLDAIGSLTPSTSATIGSDVGTYDITADFASILSLIGYNVVGSATPGTLTIDPASLLLTVDDARREYGLDNPDFTSTVTGFRNGDDVSVIAGLIYGTGATIGSDVGSYAITASGGTATNYILSYAAGTLIIDPARLMVTVDDAMREYGLANPNFTGSVSGFRNGDTASVVTGLVYDSSATIGSDVGTYLINGSGGMATNYVFDYTPGTLTIDPALLMVTADDVRREYGVDNPNFTGAVSGFRNGDTASVIAGLGYSSTGGIGSDVGTYLINGAGATATNYIFDYTPGTLTIDPAQLMVTADDLRREYGLDNPDFTATVAGLRNGDSASVVSGLGFSTSATSGSDVGAYAVTVGGGTARNYVLSYTAGTLTVDPALLMVTADDALREYGVENPDFTGSVSGFRNGDTASVITGLGYSSDATIGSDVGTYLINGSGASAGNYIFAYTPGTLTIDPALLMVTADDALREYGLENPDFTGSVSGFRNGDTASVITGLGYSSDATVGSDVGTYLINGSGASAGNYIFAYTPGTLTIDPALLMVTADDALREYGLENPDFTGSVSGFRNGDTASVITGLGYSSDATISSDVGTYLINGSGASAGNYIFAYTPGTLTIDPALLMVTADDVTREFGLDNPDFTGSVSGFRNGDTASVITGLGYSSDATSRALVGRYDINGSGASATNYVFSYTPGTLTVEPSRSNSVLQDIMTPQAGPTQIERVMTSLIEFADTGAMGLKSKDCDANGGEDCVVR